MDNKTTGGLSEGLEIEVNDRYEDYSIGDPVRFLDRKLITTGKHSCLKGNQWVHGYRFRPAENCRMERMDNLKLAGAAVRGSVLGTTPESSRLALATDPDGQHPQCREEQRPCLREERCREGQCPCHQAGQCLRHQAGMCLYHQGKRCLRYRKAGDP